MNKSRLPQPDLQLICECRSGDHKAFRRLVEKYMNFVFSVAVKNLGNEDDAKDIVQETFIRVWKNLKWYDQNKVFTTWMYTIVVHLCCDLLKSKKRKKIFENDVVKDQLGILQENRNEDLFDQKKTLEKINILTKDLTEKQRMVFILRDLHELSVKETGEILKLTEGAVKTNLYYARLSIRKSLINEKYGEEK
jgi:RNA polymerase sigma-70 factor, ECF subfamily